MRKATFKVPAEVMGGFVKKLIELELNNTIVGITKDWIIEIEVLYERGENDNVDHLENHLEKIINY